MYSISMFRFSMNTKLTMICAVLAVAVLLPQSSTVTAEYASCMSHYETVEGIALVSHYPVNLKLRH